MNLRFSRGKHSLRLGPPPYKFEGKKRKKEKKKFKINKLFLFIILNSFYKF